jgi:hypothetical protein
MDPEPVGRPVRQRLPQRLQAPVRRGMCDPVGGEQAPRPPFMITNTYRVQKGTLTTGKSHATITWA